MMTDEEMKKEFIKVELLYSGESQGSYIERPENIPDIMKHELEGLAEGDSYKLTKLEMTEEEFTSLPEFQGF